MLKYDSDKGCQSPLTEEKDVHMVTETRTRLLAAHLCHREPSQRPCLKHIFARRTTERHAVLYH